MLLLPAPSLLAALLLAPPALAAPDADPAPLVVWAPVDALPAAPDAPPDAGPSLLPLGLRIGVVPGPSGETALDLGWRLRVVGDEPVLLRLVGPELALTRATLDGRPLSLGRDADGWRVLVLDAAPGEHRLRLQGTVATPAATASRGALALGAMLLPRTRVEVPGGLELSAPDGLALAGGLQVPAGEQLSLSWQPPAPPPPRPQVIRARVGADLQVDGSGVLGRARLRFVVVDQPARSLSFRLAGAVTDLEVTGAAVAGFSRQGDTVRIDLAEPVEGAVPVEVAWRAAAPGPEAAAAAVPVPVTTSGLLDEGWVTVRAGDQGTVVPDVGRGLSAVPAARVPAWARGLVPGPVVTSLALTGKQPALRLAVLDLSPVEAPPTFVDEARFEVAYAAHGRALLRATLDVRNDRSQYLPVDLPPGAVLLGVRVAGRVVQPVRDGDRRLYVPLEKSVETLTGLVAFPVELGMILPDEPWEARGHRQLSLPGVHAPVAQARWELLLPPGVDVREVEGDLALEGTLEARGATLTYGRAVAMKSGEVEVEEARRRDEDAAARSREAWNSAYRAYQDNQFETAEQLLEQSLAWDQDNDAAQQLMGNVQVLLGQDEEAARSEQSRRIRAMARSKMAGASSTQLELKERARDAVRAGDYDEAEQVLGELRTLTERLVQVEDTEVVDQKVALAETERQLAEVREKKKQDGAEHPEDRARREHAAQVRAKYARQQAEAVTLERRAYELRREAEETGAVAFELDGQEIRGELLSPDGDLLDAVEGGVEGEVVGGVVGGVLGGVVGSVSGRSYGAALGGAAAAAPEEVTLAAPEPEPAPEPSVAEHYALGGDAAGYDLYDEEPLEEEVEEEVDVAEEIVRVEAATTQRGPLDEIWADDVSVVSESVEVRASRRALPRISLPSLGARKEAPAGPPPPPPPHPVGPSTSADKPVGPRPVAEMPVGVGVLETHPVGPPPPPPQTTPDALSMDPAVTAAPLLRPVPRAGDHLALTRQLVPAGQSLTVVLSYKTRTR